MSRLVAGIALVTALGACVPPEEPDAFVRYKPDTAMGAIQRAGVLVVGVEADLAPFSAARGAQAQGMIVDLASLVAQRLRVEMAVRTASTGALVAAIDAGEVDIAFPAVPVTEDLVRDHGVTAPYWVGHQRLLVPAGSGIAAVADLAGRRVCATIDDATGVDPATLDPRVDVVRGGRGRCLRALRRGAVDAVTAHDVFLLGLLDELGAGYRIAGDQLSTAGFAPLVTRELPGFGSFVAAVFADAETDGDWEAAYRRWIAPLAGGASAPAPEPPDLTVEEAAALYPSAA